MLRKIQKIQFERNFRTAVQSVTTEDYEQMRKYRHKEDSLACLVGRLFLRKAIVQSAVSNAQWADIEIARTERGKPYIVRPELAMGINVSHQVLMRIGGNWYYETLNLFQYLVTISKLTQI